MTSVGPRVIHAADRRSLTISVVLPEPNLRKLAPEAGKYPGALQLTNGWVAAARAIPGSAEPAVDALDIAASAVLLLMICWNVPKFTAAILGGTPAFTGGDAVGVVGGLAQGALLAGTAVAGGVALGAKVLAAKGGAMSVSQAAGMGAGRCWGCGWLRRFWRFRRWWRGRLRLKCVCTEAQCWWWRCSSCANRDR